MDEQTIKTRISALPQSPGIYIYTDTTGNVLYVGKAKNLRSRVRSYFGKSADLGPAKEKMVKLIADIETIATHTELEALVLEANLIRKHQPPYNVLLRDDKYYLFIKITKDIPARIFPVRKIIQDGSKYFGPYSSASSVRTTLKLLRRIFPFREEKDRPRDIIFPHTLFKNYLSPSYEGEREGVVRDELKRNDPSTPPLIRGEENATNVARFLNGNRQEIIRTLQQGIEDAAKDLHYEQAALFRDQLQAIERLEGSQKVYLPRKVSFDIISISQAKHQSAGNVLQIREGKLIGKQTFLLRHRSFVMPEDILRQFIMQYYSVAQDVPKKIFIPIPLPDAKTLAEWIQNFSPPYQGGVGGGDVVEFAVPLRGTKKQLLAMGELNAKNLLREEEI
ncbi:MAG TPA: GIY-YIG nuclease family protein, partial [Candidatus Andersenbacteria bacterium]|nr:GIY-YIG nuclease family protein [Candidatus Andersenbacteria bacterium]